MGTSYGRAGCDGRLRESARAALGALTYSRIVSGVSARPKQKCCLSKPRCMRCPIRLLSEGKLDAAGAKKIFAKKRNRKALKKAKLPKAA